MRSLHICHNHPDLHPGGTEVFSHALFRELCLREDQEAFYLACTNEIHRSPNPGTPFMAMPGVSNELLLFSGNFDRFRLSQLDLHGLMPELVGLLRDLRPEVVHFHHLLLIGVEAIKVVRDTLPRARILLTLHDYYPICHHDGQMMKVDSGALCPGASPVQCARCFPQHGSDEFLTREIHIKRFFSLVDWFVAPSRFLQEKYVAWGLPAQRIEIIGNGSTRRDARAPSGLPAVEPAPVRFGFFGNLSRSKGIDVLLDAAFELLARGRDFELRIHGRAWFQDESFVDGFRRRVKRGKGRIRHIDGYSRESVPGLMNEVHWVVVPSIWWENDPIVIQEALWCARPVICADIGGMAEAVRPGRDGLHFRARDSGDLARVMSGVIDTGPANAPAPAPPAPIGAVADRYLDLYRGADAAATTQEDVVAGGGITERLARRA